MPKVIVIVGPTASGKSALAVEIARAIGGEVVSADSRQVYRGLSIATGKVTKREMRGIPHHLLDVSSPKKVFTAAHYVRLGRKAITDILKRGKVPIICGGTGFYIDALLGRIDLPEVAPNTHLRASLAKESTSDLYERLKHVDPVRADSIDQHNRVRLIRALEIADAIGRSPAPASSPRYETIWIGILPDNEALHAKIHTRLLARMRAGMRAEAERAHADGLSYKRMDALGLECRHLGRLLQKTISREAFLTDLEADIKQYAKRQITYWKRNTDIMWLKPSSQPRELVAQALAHIQAAIPFANSKNCVQ